MSETKNPAEKYLNQIISYVSEKIGINFRDTHKNAVLRFIEKRADDLGFSYADYLLHAKENGQELCTLINAATVNETYFFREEKQFDLLKKLISEKNKIDVWSAACSSGEEIYSIKLLCDSLNVKADFFASDINTESLDTLKKGLYGKRKSVREIDGKNYHKLLSPYLAEEKIVFPSVIRDFIECSRINLIDFKDYNVLVGRRFDFIFIRNVFIYFSAEKKYQILNYIAENHLKKGGYIFVSLSEIAQFEDRYLAANLEKICQDDIFIFHKSETERNTEVKDGQ